MAIGLAPRTPLLQMSKPPLSIDSAGHLVATGVLFLYPVLILLLTPMDSFGLTLFALGGIWVIWRQGKEEPATREEKLFYLAMSAFFLAALVTTLLGGIDQEGIKKLNKFLHLLLAIPAYLFLRHTGVNLAALWYGLVAGAMVAAITALVEIAGQPPGFRASGATHPIIFGNLALAMGAMSLAGTGWFRARARWLIVLPVTAAFCGLLASLLSHARGGWVAVPLLTLIFVWYARRFVSPLQRWSAVALLAAVVLASYWIPATGVKNTVDRTITNVAGYLQSDTDDETRGTSIGSRFEMWQAAWRIYRDNPVFGVGWGHYKRNAQSLVDKGERHPSTATWGHPHNQFLSAMANGGTIALIAIVLLFLVPAGLFIRCIKAENTPNAQRLALAGLLLITAFIAFGLSEAIFERICPVSFFSFYMAALFAAIRTQPDTAENRSVRRKQHLSTIIIAQDEADRIESCLQSVAGWADEIIVLDSGSSDNTVEIARRYTDRVFETDWPGYGPQKQRALEKARCDWVLSIDADEQVSPELRRDIDRALDANPKCVGYRTPWAVVVYGHRLDFGRSARAPLRLFRRKGARFSNDQVHEKVLLPKGKIGKLRGRLLHFTHRDYGHALYKNAHYAWLGAQKRFAGGRKGGGLLLATLRGIWTFILIYIFRLGFLDGRVGFLVAALYSQNSFNKYAGLWTLRRQASLARQSRSNRYLKRQ